MKKILYYLEDLDLSELEAKLYLTLLETGPITVRELTEIVGIKRTTAYVPMSRLIERGLVMKLVKGNKPLVAANDPEEHLQHLVESKLEKAKEIKEKFPEILNTITSSLPERKDIGEAEIILYKGIKNVKKIYEEAFSGKEFRSFVKVEETAVLSSDNPSFFNEAFKKNKKLKVWEIIYESPFSRRQAIKMLSQNNHYFYKFMPPDLKWSLTSEDILIYDRKVAIINYKGKVNSIVLHSPDFYHNLKELFNFIWRIVPEPTP